MPNSSNTLLVAYAVTAISVFGASAISPVLPDVVHGMAVSEAAASLLISLFILPMALITPLAGFIADRIAIRPVLIASLLLYAAGGVACYAAANFPLLLLSRIVQGIGAAALELFGLVLLIETVPPAQLHTAIGRNAAVIGLSTAIAPLLSGVLALVSWRTPFLPALAALPLALATLAIDEPARVDTVPVPALFDLKRLMTRPQVLASFALIFIAFYFLFGVLLAFVPEMAAHEGLTSPLLIALLPALSAVSIGLAAPISGKLMQRIPARGVALRSFACYTLAMVAGMISVGHGVGFLVPACLLIGIGHGLVFPLAQTLMASQSPATGRVLFISFNIAAIGAAQTLAPIATSWVDSTEGLPAVFSVSAALAALLTVGTLTRRDENRKAPVGPA